MKWIRVKSDKDISLDGVTIETTWDDNNISVMILKAGDKQLKFQQGNYSVGVFIPEPPKTIEAFRVTATVPGVGEVVKTFDSEFKATRSKNDLEKLLNYKEDSVRLEKIQILESELTERERTDSAV